MKAAAGGGGRGIKIVSDATEMSSAFETASAEARQAFGDDRLYIEKFIPNARHIEVQIIGDRYGNVIHLGERDCSLQRRHQKLLEETPCPVIDYKTAGTRSAMRRSRSPGIFTMKTWERWNSFLIRIIAPFISWR